MRTSQSFPTIGSMGDRLRAAVAQQFETFCRALLRGPDVAGERGFLRLVTGEPHPLGNFAIVSDPADPEQTRLAIAPLCEIDAPSAVIFLDLPSQEVDALVGERGYALAESMPAMAVDLDELARPDLPAGYAFIEIDRESQREAWDDALAVGYGLPRSVAALFGSGSTGTGATAGSTRSFAVMKDGTIVATSMLFLEGGLAGIYCVATRPEHRGRGLGAYVTAEPLRPARDLGYRVGILQSSAMGESVYRRLGFESHGVLPLYVRAPAGA